MNQKINNYLSLKLHYFRLWFIKNSIKDMTFSTYEHDWFENDLTLVFSIQDRFDNYWHFGLGVLKSNIKTYKIGKWEHPVGLGGMSWDRIFGNWFICWYRDNNRKLN